MSETIGRFVRVMTGGRVATQAVIAVRNGKVTAALTALNAQIGRLTAAGVRNQTLDTLYATLRADQAAALALPESSARYDALDEVKQAARVAAAGAVQQATAVLALVAVHAQKSAAALAAVNKTVAAIQQTQDPADQQRYASALSLLQNRRVTYSTVNQSAEINAAIAELDRVTAQAEQLTAGVTAVNTAAQARTAKLTEIDTALAKLRTTSATIGDAALQADVAQDDAALTTRRDLLANAQGVQIAAEMTNAPALITEIADATQRAAASAATVRDRAAKLTELGTSLAALRATGQTIADPTLRTEAAQRLAGLVARRDALANATGQQIAVELAKATQLAADIAAAAAQAAGAALPGADTNAALGEIDKALGNLKTINQKVVDGPMVQAVSATLADLTARRDALARAAQAQLPAELAKVPELKKDIAAAAALSEKYAKWGEDKPGREMIGGACNQYIPVAKKRDKPRLEQLAVQLLKDLKLAEAEALNDPTKALGNYEQIKTDYAKTKQEFFDQLLGGPLLNKSADLEASNPTGAEAQMRKALDSSTYEQRMMEAWNTAMAFGSPLIRKLSPGEAVAVYTYTSNDYTKINGTALGYYAAKDDDEADQIAIMTAEAKKAIAKLDNYVGITKRGDRGFTGDEAQYTLGNEFEIRAFWSTGVGFSFPGKWQVTINGKSGKNVKTVSEFPKEAEVLFPPGSKFKVTDRDDSGSPTTIYVTVDQIS